MGFLHLLARWDWLSIYLPWLWWLLLAAGGVRSLIRVRERDWIIEPRGKLWPVAVEPVIGLALFGYAAIGLFYPGPATDLSFPLRGGSFAVGQGGNGVALNYHNANATQRYALDVGALDGFGRRADGLIPHRAREVPHRRHGSGQPVRRDHCRGGRRHPRTMPSATPIATRRPATTW